MSAFHFAPEFAPPSSINMRVIGGANPAWVGNGFAGGNSSFAHLGAVMPNTHHVIMTFAPCGAAPFLQTAAPPNHATDKMNPNLMQNSIGRTKRSLPNKASRQTKHKIERYAANAGSVHHQAIPQVLQCVPTSVQDVVEDGVFNAASSLQTMSSRSENPVDENESSSGDEVKPHKRPARLCRFPNCRNSIVQGGVCISHGAKRKQCNHPGCTKNVKKAGMCSAHGPARKMCERDDCPNIAVQGGLCISHGARKKLCTHADCSKKARTVWKGMCKRHFDQSMAMAFQQSVAAKFAQRR